MKLLSHRTVWALGISVGACAMGAGAAACGSSSSSGAGGGSGGDGSAGGPCSNPNALTIAFNPMYSGFISSTSQHQFQVPAVVLDVSQANVTWSASDPAAVGFQNDPAAMGGTLITILNRPASGMVTINAQIGNVCGSAPLTITQFTEDDWNAGHDRYNNMQGLINPFANQGGGDGGTRMMYRVPSSSDPSPLEPTDGGPGPACNDCHGPTATGGVFQGIQHTPQQTGGFSDSQLTDIIINAIIPDGGTYDNNIIPYQYWQFFHKWKDLTMAQQTGMIAYLRSLTPVPQTGKSDFSGLFARDGGGNMPPPGDDGGGSSESDGSSQSDATITDGAPIADGGTPDAPSE